MPHGETRARACPVGYSPPAVDAGGPQVRAIPTVAAYTPSEARLARDGLVSGYLYLLKETCVAPLLHATYDAGMQKSGRGETTAPNGFGLQ